MGTYIAYFADPEGWANTMLKNGTTQEYIRTMNDAASWWVLAVMIIGTILVLSLIHIFSGTDGAAPNRYGRKPSAATVTASEYLFVIGRRETDTGFCQRLRNGSGYLCAG